VTTNAETRLAATTTDAPLWTPPTLVLGDSFTQSSRDALAPLFASAQIVHPETANVDAASVVRAVQGRRHGRARDRRAQRRHRRRPVVGEPFLAALEQALAPPP
jgi:hypothetical protein